MKVITLTLSPAYDVHCNAEKIEADRENFAEITDIDIGGKGVNVSRALNVFGVENTALLVLGEENSSEYVEKTEKEGITLEKIFVPGRIRENITVHTENGRETRISFRGAKADPCVIKTIEGFTDSALGKGDILTFTGSIPEGISINEAKEFIKRLMHRGVRVIVDSRSFSLSDIADIKPYLIKPNEYEAGAYFGKKIATESDACQASLALRHLGIENVMITLGEKGAALSGAEGEYFAHVPPLEAVSTIGAGDSCIAGFIYALSLGLDTKEILKMSAAFGSAACLKSGTKPPQKTEILKILDCVSVKTVPVA